MRLCTALFLLVAGLAAASEPPVSSSEISTLREQIARQQKQIDELRDALDAQKKLLDRLAPLAEDRAPAAAPAAAATPPGMPATAAPAVAISGPAAPAANSPTFAGIHLSGDFRYRLDVAAREGNDAAGPLRNIRNRYRVRLNLDKDIDPTFGVHVQLSTGPYNVVTTNDQDFGGMNAKQPFSVAEAWVRFRPNPNVSLRVGRMEEVFADNMRFLWDDDVRFNGFEQRFSIPLHGGFLGLRQLEFAGGEYILGHPNIALLGEGSPYLHAGFALGQKVPDSTLIHPGLTLRGTAGTGWNYAVTATLEAYRNASLVQFASTSEGAPLLVGNTLGLAPSNPISAQGNATTMPGGPVYWARHFEIAHLAYRLQRNGIAIAGREMPAWLDFQAARNLGTSRYNTAYMCSANLGEIRRAGDLRLLYQYAYKDANSMISQFTDDDLGTGSGVNIKVHAVRADVGLTRFLQWQNLFFIQHERRGNIPAQQFYVPLPGGANPTFRFLSQLAFTF